MNFWRKRGRNSSLHPLHLIRSRLGSSCSQKAQERKYPPPPLPSYTGAIGARIPVIHGQTGISARNSVEICHLDALRSRGSPRSPALLARFINEENAQNAHIQARSRDPIRCEDGRTAGAGEAAREEIPPVGRALWPPDRRATVTASLQLL